MSSTGSQNDKKDPTPSLREESGPSEGLGSELLTFITVKEHISGV
jgi:hypothetical protein